MNNISRQFVIFVLFAVIFVYCNSRQFPLYVKPTRSFDSCNIVPCYLARTYLVSHERDGKHTLYVFGIVSPDRTRSIRKREPLLTWAAMFISCTASCVWWDHVC